MVSQNIVWNYSKCLVFEKTINQIFFIIYLSLYPKYVDLSKGLPLECTATFYNPKYKYTANRRKMKYKKKYAKK